MIPGRLKHRISVWRNFGQKNAYGEVAPGWRVVASVRAEAIVQNSRRAMAEGEVWYPRAAAFKVRRHTDVTEGDRIYHASKYYDVISVTEDEADRSITINTELVNE